MGTISAHLITELLNLERKTENTAVLLTVMAGCCTVMYDSLSGWRLQDLVPAVAKKKSYSICIKQISGLSYTMSRIVQNQYCLVIMLHNVNHLTDVNILKILTNTDF